MESTRFSAHMLFLLSDVKHFNQVKLKTVIMYKLDLFMWCCLEADSDKTTEGQISSGDAESWNVRYESGFSGVQVMVLFNQKAEGRNSLHKEALLHPIYMQVVMEVSLQERKKKSIIP